MNQVRWFVIVLLVGTAAVFQSAFLPNVGLRVHSAAPVFMVILALAQRLGFFVCVVIGGLGGLLVDLVPPASGPLGMNALLGVLAAAVMVGWARMTATDTAGLGATLGVLVATIASVCLARTWLTTLLVGHVPFAVAAQALLRDCVIATLLAPIIAPLVESLTRRRLGEWNTTAIVGRGV